MAGTHLKGLMQAWPLTLDKVLHHAARWHSEREVVSYSDSATRSAVSYRQMHDDALRFSAQLMEAGVKPGDRVATLAMNSGEHMLSWYAIAGIGAVCHTLNPRLGETHLAWIANHAQDTILLLDGAFAEIGDKIAATTLSIRELIFFSEPASTPKASWRLLEPGNGAPPSPTIWGNFPEDTAAGLCYTSGTTGDPKGVLYSHRSNLLHTLISIAPDMFDLSSMDVVMPLVPLYHANAWGLVFSGPAVGAKMVMPGADLTGPSLYQRMADEQVTWSAAVPTAWLGLLDHMEQTQQRLPHLRRAIVGGAALSEDLLARFEQLDIPAFAAWGMTELSPLGGVSSQVPERTALTQEEQIPFRVKQGRVGFGIDMRIVDEADTPQVADGSSPGALQMRGPAVLQSYYQSDETAVTQDGWLDTGDIATIDPMGYMKIVDRSKDVIKSGGEWISSIEIENAASGFPGVALSAVVGVPHPRWDERPLLILEAVKGEEPDIEALRGSLAAQLPKWWLPEDIRVVDKIPLGPTGKIDKRALRTMTGHG